ncbi:MAG: 3-deoxy-8-phosphooctulonate synthase [Deltaproteobacteria bacterium]|nr:3-deoxy-8-phosphooctulonate synthase [Deltaproteobacteria bacterium]
MGNFTIREEGPFFLVAGPCVIETEDITLEVGYFLKELGEKLEIPIIFKTSYDKANRTSLSSYRGLGILKGLEIIQRVKERTGLPVLSDIHKLEELPDAAAVLDVLQIPAFLCRQTDLLVAAASTRLPINVKKGQFLSPLDMKNVADKVVAQGNRRLLLTERGSSFGYNNLVVDMRAIPLMKTIGFPVIFDATHSVQLPGAAGTCSGGQREFVAYLSRAAVAAGCNGVFLEVHPAPEFALCDGPNSLPLGQVEPLLALLKDIHQKVHSKA